MTPKALLPLALLAALYAGCNGRTSEKDLANPPPAPPHEHTSGAEHAFPDPLTYANHLDDPGRDAWQKPEEVVALLQIRPGMTVVDLGVGTGYFLGRLSEAVGPRGRVIALDTVPGMIELTRARIERDHVNNVDPRVVDPDDPGLAPQSVDRVLVVDTWHHISRRSEYAKKLLTALRPGGLLLIVDYDVDSPRGPPRAMKLKADTVVRELEAGGFVTDVLAESLPHQYVIAGRARP
ncbi:MAG: hypothetical protein AMJ62_11220 [Myxococcales bacterium SG8_38]|nr:MAG: hypothetical protein AMJ62_11220 [Myxococcales bacterium SG8_38]